MASGTMVDVSLMKRLAIAPKSPGAPADATRYALR